MRQSSIRHPLRDDLQRVCRDPDERDNVRMSQSFPQNCLFDERLRPLRAFLSGRELIIYHTEHEPPCGPDRR